MVLVDTNHYDTCNWRDAGVVERGRLEICCTFRGTEGSNPSLSAILKIPFIAGFFCLLKANLKLDIIAFVANLPIDIIESHLLQQRQFDDQDE